ncbi:hypothetical protein [Sphingomonas bacterium]|uniref:hypothetical protein n=1 Tax=Sphingomonas bacterium TaxID=1895847 RepID=UPI0015763643|nr:hypothetical protein [Sphingomonas bacterium]
MSQGEISFFFANICRAIAQNSRPGALIYICMDWRVLPALVEAARPSLGAPINIAVWVKDRAGMGGFLRSRDDPDLREGGRQAPQ